MLVWGLPIPMNNFISTLLNPTPKNAPWYALFAGGVAVLGLPSGPTPIALIVGLMILIRLLPNLSSRRGAWLGFLFGLSYFSFGFSWLLTSLHVYGGLPLVVSLAMLLGLSAAMALYPALFGACLPLLIPKPKHRSTTPSNRDWLFPLAAPALWTATEWLRTWLLSGFAWNLVGYGWNPWESILQVADLGGIFLLSWLMVFSASMLAVLWLRRSGWRETGIVCALLAITLGTASLYGVWRIHDLDVSHPKQGHPKQSGQSSIRVAIVQGNISQHLKWLDTQRDKTVARYLALSRTLPKPLDLVVWPETAMAFFLQAHPNHADQIRTLSQEIDAPILTGAPTVVQSQNNPLQYQYYNSMVMLDGSGSLHRRYDKYHLVPFGEFIPLRQFAPDTFRKFTDGTEDFSPGPGPIPILWDKGNIGPLICYEAIFPDEVRALASAGVSWLVNITNDAWFGDSAKPQHLAMVRLRAIENRTPMIRAANTGISAVFDHLGRELGRTTADKAETLVVTVSQGHGERFYQRHGSLWIWVWVGLCLASWWIGRQMGMVTPHRLSPSKKKISTKHP